MSSLETAVRHVNEATAAESARWALVGGFAVAARAEPRFTRDLDVAVAVADDRTAERVVGQFRDRGFVVSATVEQQAVGRLATARMTTRDGPPVDLLFASSGIESEVVNRAESLEVVPGLPVPVASTGHLIAMKLLAEGDDRPTDRGDLLALARVATPEDLELAGVAIDLIEDRGFSRGRDLKASLAALTGNT